MGANSSRLSERHKAFLQRLQLVLDIADYYSGAGVSNTFKTPSFQKAALSKFLASPANNAPKDAYNTTGKGYPGEFLNYLVI